MAATDRAVSSRRSGIGLLRCTVKATFVTEDDEIQLQDLDYFWIDIEWKVPGESGRLLVELNQSS